MPGFDPFEQEPVGQGNVRGEGPSDFVPQSHGGEEVIVPLDPRDYTGPPACWLTQDHGKSDFRVDAKHRILSVRCKSALHITNTIHGFEISPNSTYHL